MDLLKWLKLAGIILSICFIIVVAIEHLIPTLLGSTEYRAKSEIMRYGESILISHLSPDVETQFIPDFYLFAFRLSQGGTIKHIRDHIAVFITECHISRGCLRSLDSSNVAAKRKFHLRHMDDGVDM